MATASVRDVKKMRESQSAAGLPDTRPEEEGEGSLAKKLYTKSEQSLLEATDWGDLASPEKTSTLGGMLTEEDLKLVEEELTPVPQVSVAGSAQGSSQPGSRQGSTRSAETLTSGGDTQQKTARSSGEWDKGSLTMLRESLPYWGSEGMESLHEAVRKALASLTGNEANQIDQDTGENALLLCAQYGAGELVELLVVQHADVNSRLPSGATALHYMTNLSTLSSSAAAKLLEYGCDPNIPEQHNGATALHYAADSGDMQLCELLVRYGADAGMKEFSGYDASGYASGAGHHGVAEYLRDQVPEPGVYCIDLPMTADSVVAQPVKPPPKPDDDDATTATQQQKKKEAHEKKKQAARKRRASRGAEELQVLRESKSELAKLERDRERLESEQKVTKLKLEAEEAAARLERSEAKAHASAEEAATLRAKLDLVQAAADKATSELRMGQHESTAAVADSTALAAAAQARAEEAEKARARAVVASESAGERAAQAELALAVARSENEIARREKNAAQEALEEQVAKSRQLEAQCQAEKAVLEVVKSQKNSATQPVDEQVLKGHVENAVEETARKIQGHIEESLKTATDKMRQQRAQERAEICKESSDSFDRIRDDQSRVLDGLKDAFEETKKHLEARLVQAEAATEQRAAELKTSMKESEKRFSEKETRMETEFKRLRETKEEQQAKLLKLTSELGAEAAKTVELTARAVRAEERASNLENKLLSLAQASSSDDQKFAAMESTMEARVAELQKKCDEAVERAEYEKKLRLEASSEEAKVTANLDAALKKYDENLAGPRLQKELESALIRALEHGAVKKIQDTEERISNAEQARLSKLIDTMKKEAEAERAKFYQQTEDLKRDVKYAKDALTKAEARVVQAEAGKEAASSELARAREDLASVKADEKTARFEAKEARDLLAQSNLKAVDAAAESAAIREQVSAAREAMTRAEEDKTALRNELRRAEENVAQARSEQRRAEDESRAVTARLQREAEKNATNLTVESRQAALEVEKKYEADLNEARRASAKFRAEAEASKERADSLMERCSELSKRAEAADVALEAMRRERDAAVISLRETTEAADAELKHARSQISASKAELASVNTLADQLRQLEQRNAQLDRDLTREAVLRKKLHNTIEDMKGKIRVLCRVRPFSKKEANEANMAAVVKDGEASVTVLPPKKGDKKRFTFDTVFEGVSVENSQPKIFEDVRQLVTSAVDGYNVCLFAYGQTGSGKTYTMGSSSNIGDALHHGQPTDDAGIAPRTAHAVFEILEDRASQCESEIKLSMFEVYCDKIIDLLNPDKQQQGHLKITLAEHSPTGLVSVDHSHHVVATDVKGLVKGMAKGIGARTTHATRMNMESSRSHLIMALEVRTTNRRTGAVVAGKITLVDLAGSERVEKSGATGERLKEATAINKSLSALGDVISSLTSGNGGHVPFRNHPLTMLMSDSIGGSAKTMMIVCASPALSNVSETISSLNFATRCKDVTSNADPRATAAELSELRTEVARLRRQTAKNKAESGIAMPRSPASLNVAPRTPAVLSGPRHA